MSIEHDVGKSNLSETKIVIAQKLKIIENVSRSAKKTRAALDDGQCSVTLFKKMVDLAASVRELNNIGSDCQQLIDSLELAAKDQFLTLEADFAGMVTRQGWSIDGYWPKFYVSRGVPVEFDDKKLTVRIDDVETSPVLASKLIDTLKPKIRELIPDKFSSSRFLQSLEVAYKAIGGQSSQIPILDLYKSVVVTSQKSKFWKNAAKSDFVGLNISQFRARLSRCLEDIASGPTVASEIQVRMLPPLDPKDALFMYLPSERRFGFVGRIEITR